MRSVLRLNSPAAGETDRIRPVELADESAIRAAWGHSFDTDTLVDALWNFPGRSLWNPVSREVITVIPWRLRTEIASIREIRAIRGPESLLRAASARAQDLDAEAIVCMEWESTRKESFYSRSGFDLLDTVVSYELVGDLAHIDENSSPHLSPLELDDRCQLREVTRLDNRAFPWLWWNNEKEFQSGIGASETETWGARLGNDLVGYVSFSHFPEWGHIDRLAVDPNLQGKGIGRAMVKLGVERIRRHAPIRVVLSTQLSNVKSQSLYEMLGFQPTGENAYHIYGQLFGEFDHTEF